MIWKIVYVIIKFYMDLWFWKIISIITSSSRKYPRYGYKIRDVEEATLLINVIFVLNFVNK